MERTIEIKTKLFLDVMKKFLQSITVFLMVMDPVMVSLKTQFVDSQSKQIITHMVLTVFTNDVKKTLRASMFHRTSPSRIFLKLRLLQQ